MASNFDFLRLHLPSLHAEAAQAEALAHTAPRASCFGCRFVLEMAVLWMYEHDRTLSRPYEDRLGAMLHDPSFKDNLPAQLFAKVRSVYLLGNQAAHRAQAVGPRDAARAVEDLFHFLYWVSRTYSEDAAKHPRVSFDARLLPRGAAAEPSDSQLKAQEAAWQMRLAAESARLAAKEKTLAETEGEIARLKAELEALKARNQQVPDDHDYNEAQTRDLFIDLLLREAGWPLDKEGVHTEYPVEGMPNNTGNGFVDYVLWGDDGIPLALVEAKRTRLSEQKGRKQASLYADCLQKKFGRRPVIFLSNGYNHLIWDDASGPPRPVAGFYDRYQLEHLHWRRGNAVQTAGLEIDRTIVERAYQSEAIRAVCEHFEAGHRRALVVMATGTGKTRMTIALVDLLIRAGLVRRVLFLADRTNLLTQARRAFKQHLPRVTTVDLLQDGDADGQVYLSTYPTMVNLIDRLEGGRRRFGPGFFDLVVTDEAHRSIYKKYASIFSWFDGRLVGLTATPRDDVHRDTYRLFELEKGVPTFSYDLATAVRAGWLVPPLGKAVPFRFLRRGIKYADLSEEEKEAYEEAFADEDGAALPDRIDARALNDWVFNQDTVDRALELVMEHGAKVAEGTRLGKTIVFARNHKHAEYIVERFDAKWPMHKGVFCQVIDSHYDYAQALLDDFAKPASPLRIAVSVNMLDTGVDVPEVLNLVLFTATASKTRFQQMIGRGTRLCPDLLGPGRDKEHFLVFDLCSNFEFFGEGLGMDQGVAPTTLTERLLRQRAELAVKLPEEETELRASLLDHLHAHVRGMDTNSFRVREKRAAVEKLSDRAAWDALHGEGCDAINEAVEEVAVLPTSAGADDELTARQFDSLILRLQVGLLHPDRSFERSQEELRRIARNLLEKADALPMIAQQRPLLLMIGEDEWWATGTLRSLEQVRVALRGLAKFVDRTARKSVYTDFEDALDAGGIRDVGEVPGISVAGTVDVARYRRKVEAFLRAHESHTAVWKLRNNRQLTETDLQALQELLESPDAAGSATVLRAVVGTEPLPAFIRRIVGLDEVAVRQELDAYVALTARTAAQARFLDMIVAYLTRNGVMDPAALFSPPLSTAHPGGLDAAFADAEIDKVIAFVRRVNENASWVPATAAG